jgi:hypothetical protein
MSSRSLSVARYACFSHLNRLCTILTLDLFLTYFLSFNASAAQVTLNWQDPNNNPGEVGGYNLYYWQTNWTAPASINVGNLKAYTSQTWRLDRPTISLSLRRSRILPGNRCQGLSTV